METLFYRPLVQYTLPFVFAFICRVLASVPEAFMWVMSKTLLRKYKEVAFRDEDYRPSHLQAIIDTPESVQEIESQLSFGLLLGGLGIVFAMVYILVLFNH